MKRPLCTNTEDGTCPSWALNGTRFCLHHTEPARLLSGEPVDTGYRQGGLASSPPVARARVDLGPAATAVAELAAAAAEVAAVPPVLVPPGWLARTLRRATS